MEHRLDERTTAYCLGGDNLEPLVHHAFNLTFLVKDYLKKWQQLVDIEVHLNLAGIYS